MRVMHAYKYGQFPNCNFLRLPRSSIRPHENGQFQKRLETFDFKVAVDIFNLVNHDRDKESILIELFVKYYQSMGKSNEFICWVIEWEVSKTENPSSLFRLESLATSLLLYYFFSESGNYFLSNTVLPLIEDVKSTLAKSQGEGNLQNNIPFIFTQTKNFLHRIHSNRSLLPVELRMGFQTLHERVKEHFPGHHNVVAVVLFLRFLCPSILQPTSFGILDEPIDIITSKTLMPIARLLQLIANEQIENKIVDGHDEEVFEFIHSQIETLHQNCNYIINKKEVGVILKSMQLAHYRQEDGTIAHDSIIGYICGPEFPIPSLEVSSSARVIPSILKRRTLYTPDGRCTCLGNELDSIRVNVIFLLPESSQSNINISIIDRISKIRFQMQDLGVNQIILTVGNIPNAKALVDTGKFRGEVLIDPPGKIIQLFSLQKRKSTRSKMYVGKISKSRTMSFWDDTRNDRGPMETDGLKRANSAIIGPLLRRTRSSKEKCSPVKVFVLFGDRISFESNFEGEIQDLINLLQACGAEPDMIKGTKKKLKKKRFPFKKN